MEKTMRKDKTAKLHQPKRIKTKLVQLICYTAAIGLLAVALILTPVVYVNSLNSAKTSLTQLCLAYSDNVDHTVDLAHEELTQLATNLEIPQKAVQVQEGKLTVEEMSEWLKTEIQPGTIFESVSMTFPNGHTWDDYDLSSRAYIQAALAGQKYINAPAFSERDKVLQYFCSAPMNNGVMDGVVFAPIGGDYFAQSLISFIEGSNYSSQAFVLDNTGKIIVHSDMQKVIDGTDAVELSAGNASYSAMVSDMIAGGSGCTNVVLEDGEKYVAAYNPVGNAQGWSLVLLYNFGDVTKASSFILLTIAGLAALLLLVSYFVASNRATTITDPIEEINQRLQKLSEGDTHSALDITRKNTEREIGELSASLSATLSHINSYIGDIGHVLTSLAGGDFTVESNVQYDGDFSLIRQSLDKIQQDLRGSFNEIYQCAHSVENSSEIVFSTSQNLAHGATEQAASVEELAATIADISQHASATSERAGEVRDLTGANEQNINSSMDCMGELKTAMSDMGESSAQISKIVKTIDDIAFQTNILALNAAVEAARAGEAGKGFAVVADEVRNLANKSAQAAQETQRLVSEAINSIEKGIDITERMNSSFNLVIDKNVVIAEKIQEIADDAEMQNQSISQINIAIDQISVVVQTNTATAEESAAASTELNVQAEKLGQTVSHFKF